MDNASNTDPKMPDTGTPQNPTVPVAPITPPTTSNPMVHTESQNTPPTPPSQPTASMPSSFSEEPTAHSSKKLLVFLILAVVVLVIAGIMFFMMQGGFTNSTTVPTPAPRQATLPTPTIEITPTRGTTDADLEMDSQDIETQLNSVENTSTGVDESLNDQAPNLQ